MEDAMAKALEVNENTEKNRKRQPQKQPGDRGPFIDKRTILWGAVLRRRR